MTYIHGVTTKIEAEGARPIEVVSTSVIGLVGTAPDADATLFPLNTPVLIAGRRTEAAGLDMVGTGRGTLPQAIDAIFDQCGAAVVVIRVDEGADAAATQSNVIGGTDVSGNYTGIQALLAAKSVVHVKPRILCAPGFDHIPAVTTELVGVADRLRAVVYASGPNTTDADAITQRTAFGSKRLHFTDPWVKVWDIGTNAEIIQPPSARVAGVRARTDAELGFWYSVSNQLINGIIGTARHVDYEAGDANARANLLNQDEVATIIQDAGYRTWGARTCSADPKFAFEAVTRIFDVVADSVQGAMSWAVDKPLNQVLLNEIVESVNAFLRELKALGAIQGGECYHDKELNTPAVLEQGKAYFKVKVTPVYVAEQLEFGVIATNDFLEIK